MQVVKLNRQGNALRCTIPAALARQVGLTSRDHVAITFWEPDELVIRKLPRMPQARSARGEQ